MKVRFDAGHKKDIFVKDILGDFVDFVPVCPELEAGFGVPREAVRLVGNIESPRIIGYQTGEDKTEVIEKYSSKRIYKSDIKNLDGYILKKNSPSCGMERVKIFNSNGIPQKNGTGLFARELMNKYPLLPVEEEGRLQDSTIRENFIVRIFAYSRMKELFKNQFSKKKIIEFHTIHKYLMLAHSPKHYKILGNLLGNINNYSLSFFKEEYKCLFMKGLKFKSTVKKNVNVLHHIVGFLKNNLTKNEKKELLEIISDYHSNHVPLIVPVTLLKHYVFKYDIEYIKNQIYLNPHPKELMLRNHV